MFPGFPWCCMTELTITSYPNRATTATLHILLFAIVSFPHTQIVRPRQTIDKNMQSFTDAISVTVMLQSVFFYDTVFAMTNNTIIDRVV